MGILVQVLFWVLFEVLVMVRQVLFWDAVWGGALQAVLLEVPGLQSLDGISLFGVYACVMFFSYQLFSTQISTKSDHIYKSPNETNPILEHPSRFPGSTLCKLPLEEGTQPCRSWLARNKPFILASVRGPKTASRL